MLCAFLIQCLGWTRCNEPRFATAPSHLPNYLLHPLALENHLKEYLSCLPKLQRLVIQW